MGWTVVHASVRGALHERQGRPNQDAIGWRRVGGAVVVALADGHGGARHVRSDAGARMAVDIALDLETGLTRSDGVPALVDRWRAMVRDAASVQPFDEHERALAGDDALGAYGSTLLAGIFERDSITLVQLGDGDILVVPAVGDTYRPIAPDPRLVANETTSLCTERAVEDTRLATIDLAVVPVELVLMATDGYGNSFADDRGFVAAGHDFRDLIRRDGLDAVGSRLAGWLAQSAAVVGDDVSVALVHRAADP